VRNGVPIFVKNGKVIDKEEKPSSIAHAPIDGLEIPEDEEKIFVSMDMIRDEIVSLQEHYDKVQEYASNLQNQVEELEGQLRARGSNGRAGMERPNEQLMAQKTRKFDVRVRAFKCTDCQQGWKLRSPLFSRAWSKRPEKSVSMRLKPNLLLTRGTGQSENCKRHAKTSTSLLAS
jgi:hypothetical protein